MHNEKHYNRKELTISSAFCVSVVCLLAWKKARATEKAKFGSWDKFLWDLKQENKFYKVTLLYLKLNKQGLLHEVRYLYLPLFKESDEETKLLRS